MNKLMKDIFLKFFNILKNYMNLTMIYHFNLIKITWKLKKWKSLLLIYIMKLSILKKFIEWLNLLEKPTLKPYIDMNTNLKKKKKNDFEKDFFKMMNNLVFSETIQKRRNYFVSEPNYHTEMFLTSRLLAIEIRTN